MYGIRSQSFTRFGYNDRCDFVTRRSQVYVLSNCIYFMYLLDTVHLLEWSVSNASHTYTLHIWDGLHLICLISIYILKNREGETIVVSGMNGPIVTQIRGLLMPEPLKELRVKNQYRQHKEIAAAQVKRDKDFNRTLLVQCNLRACC